MILQIIYNIQKKFKSIDRNPELNILMKHKSAARLSAGKIIQGAL